MRSQKASVITGIVAGVSAALTLALVAGAFLVYSVYSVPINVPHLIVNGDYQHATLVAQAERQYIAFLRKRQEAEAQEKQSQRERAAHNHLLKQRENLKVCKAWYASDPFKRGAHPPAACDDITYE